MSGWKQEWDRERFSDREKQDLAARLTLTAALLKLFKPSADVP